MGQNGVLLVGIPSRSSKFKPPIHALGRFRYENALLGKLKKIKGFKLSTVFGRQLNNQRNTMILIIITFLSTGIHQRI